MVATACVSTTSCECEHRKAPADGRGLWSRCSPPGDQSTARSVTAAAAERSSTMLFLSANAATSAWTARLLTARGKPRLVWWMSATASSRRCCLCVPQARGVVGCTSWFPRVHAVELVAQCDTLVESRVSAEFEPPPLQRLPHGLIICPETTDPFQPKWVIIYVEIRTRIRPVATSVPPRIWKHDASTVSGPTVA